MSPSLRPGGANDRVTFDPTVSSGERALRRHGDVNVCNRRQVIGAFRGEHRRNSAFAEFLAVPERILCPLPHADAAMLEAASAGLHRARAGGI